jgi:hypothetical protein
VFCIAQSTATIIRADHGFGRPIEELSQDNVVSSLKASFLTLKLESLYSMPFLKRANQANSMLKAELAANICYIITICLTKLSLLALIVNLTPNRRHQYFLFTLSGYIILWSVISVFVAAFECRVPHTWDYTRGTCINRVGDQNRSRLYVLFTVHVGCVVDCF